MIFDDPEQTNDANSSLYITNGNKIIGYRDDRNKGRLDISMCSVGDLYKSWYFHKDLGNGQTNTPQDQNRISLVYDIKLEELDIKDLSHTCFTHKYATTDRGLFVSKGLQESLKQVGQQKYINAVKHYTKDAPTDMRFIDGSPLDQIRIFSGHHRCINLEEIGETKVKARVYYLYDMPEPLNIDHHYNSIYDNTFWSPYQDDASKQPWFTLAQWENPTKSHKFAPLSSCFDFIANETKCDFTSGIDVGCGEGLYSYLTNLKFNIKVHGIDSEAGQVMRGLLAKIKYNLHGKVAFRVFDWDKYDYSKTDFGMLLSVLHHMPNPEDFLNTFLVNKKVAILEIRMGNGQQKICGSIKGFMSYNDNISMLDRVCERFQLKCKQIGVLDGDRHFLILYKG